MDVQGKVAIVTGASSGIGLACAKLLGKKGAKVVLAARSTEKLINVSSQIKGSLAVVCDMTKSADIKRMVKGTVDHFGKVDILVNNAGVGYDAPVEKINSDVFLKVFELNLMGPLLAMQEVIPAMRKEGGGSIVNVSSGTALMALPNMAAYSSLKRALVGISLTAREELKKDGISVSVVYPYITKTDFEKNTIKDGLVVDGGNESSGIPEGDSPEFVAGKILEAIESGAAEVYAHEWMGKTKE